MIFSKPRFQRLAGILSEASQRRKIVWVPINKIAVSEAHPTEYISFDPEQMNIAWYNARRMQSGKSLPPLEGEEITEKDAKIFQASSHKTHLLLDGHHRFAAAVLLGLDVVPILIGGEAKRGISWKKANIAYPLPESLMDEDWTWLSDFKKWLKSYKGRALKRVEKWQQ